MNMNNNSSQQDGSKKMFENFPFMNPQNNPMPNFDMNNMNSLFKNNFLFPLMRNNNENPQQNFMNQMPMKNFLPKENDCGEKK